MDAPKIMMVGVAALGAYAVVRALSAPKSYALGDESAESPGDTSSLVLLKDPLSLKQGQYYRGRLELPTTRLQPIPPFNDEGSEEELTKALIMLGFDDVRVFTRKEELPTGWPVGTTGAIAKGTRWFQAKWSQASMQLPRPSQIKTMWLTKNPGA